MVSIKSTYNLSWSGHILINRKFRNPHGFAIRDTNNLIWVIYIEQNQCKYPKIVDHLMIISSTKKKTIVLSLLILDSGFL